MSSSRNEPGRQKLSDRELDERGHKFVRYASRDDCNIYVKTQRAGERVLESVKQYLEKKRCPELVEGLKLKVNPKKSKVERATRAKFLGFSFWKRKGEVFIRIANRTKERFMEKMRHLTRRTRSGKLEDIIKEVNQYSRGWMAYYRLATTPSVYQELDEWTCGACHGDAASGGLNVITYADLMKGGKDGVAIVPNDSAKSLLIKIQSEKHFLNLSAADLDLIKKWIDAEALEK